MSEVSGPGGREQWPAAAASSLHVCAMLPRLGSFGEVFQVAMVGTILLVSIRVLGRNA